AGGIEPPSEGSHRGIPECPGVANRAEFRRWRVRLAPGVTSSFQKIRNVSGTCREVICITATAFACRVPWPADTSRPRWASIEIGLTGRSETSQRRLVQRVRTERCLKPRQIEAIHQHHDSISNSHHRDHRTVAQRGAQHAGDKARLFNRCEEYSRLPDSGMKPRVNQQRANPEEQQSPVARQGYARSPGWNLTEHVTQNPRRGDKLDQHACG